MALRRTFRCLERPATEGLSAQDRWCEPLGHSTVFCYVPFGGHWGTWHHMHLGIEGPKEWVFKPFVDEQMMIGGKGRMIYKQHHTPENAVIGSVWVCPNGSFKRVLSRGGAWENVNPGSTHPDEKDHDDEQSAQPETEQRDTSPEVPDVGSDQSASGDGDDGEAVSEPGGDGEEDPDVNKPAGHETNGDVSNTGEPLTSTGPIEDGSEE